MKTWKERRIQKNIIKEVKPYRYTVLRALIDHYPQFRFEDKTAHRANRVFAMLVPKDLSLHLGFKSSYFIDILNELKTARLLSDKWVVKDKGTDGVAVALDFYKFEEYADGIPGKTTWRRVWKKIIRELSKFSRRVKMRKQKQGTPPNSQ